MNTTIKNRKVRSFTIHIDAVDAEWLDVAKVRVVGSSRYGYRVAVNAKGKQRSLARLIASANANEFVLQLNGDPFDLRRANLRIVNREEYLAAHRDWRKGWAIAHGLTIQQEARPRSGTR